MALPSSDCTQAFGHKDFDLGCLETGYPSICPVLGCSTRPTEIEFGKRAVPVCPVHGIGPPAKAEPFRSVVAAILAGEPDLLSVEILRRAKLQGYTGGKTALYELIAAVRSKTIRPLVRFEGLAGEFTQHDFGQVDVRFLDGTRQRVHFFATRLKYSRWVEVTIVPDERAETLVRTLVDHFAALGGIPLLAVFDRATTVAVRWARDG
jgi:hypothetical protein